MRPLECGGLPPLSARQLAAAASRGSESGAKAPHSKGLLGLLVVLLILLPQIASACPVCYGDPNSPMARGTNNAIIFLLSIVGFVQIGFVALFWSFWRRARELRRKRDQFRLLEGGAR